MAQPIRLVVLVVSLLCFLVNIILLQRHNLSVLGLTYNDLTSEWFSYCHPSINNTTTVEATQKSSNADYSTVTTPTTIITKNDKHTCTCELISTDCLDSIRCLPESVEKSRQLMMKGVLTREIMKNQSKFAATTHWLGDKPVGKAVQYSIQDSWMAWIYRQGDLPDIQTSKSLFINEAQYKFCRKNRLKGRDCFFTKPSKQEELGDFEAAAMEMMASENAQTRATMIQSIQSEIQQYLNKSTTDWNELPGFSHLLSFANVGRILFNRQPHVREFCQRIHSYVNGSTTPSSLTTTLPVSPDSLTVSLHLRRADSCEHLQKPFSPVASSLDSPAQPTSLRKCYETRVYLDELRRVQKNMPTHRKSMEVFLSTDNSRSIMHEIQRYDMTFFQSITWHVLDVSRDIFRYDGLVEGDTHSNHASLGESAVADLWLLSHGEVFIGHLGSRFGKVGWMLATSRYQRFVPFFSVDGHSVCCEIDEPCGAVKPYIRSMENCLTFAHELFGGMEMNPGYWQIGSIKRIMNALRFDAMRMHAQEDKSTWEEA